MTQACGSEDYDFEEDTGGPRLVPLVDGARDEDNAVALADLVAGGPAVSIGRAPESGLVLDHVQVSSQHASVVLLANGMYALNILSASTYTAIRPAGGAEISYMVLAAENTATNVRFEPTLPLADGDILRFGGGLKLSGPSARLDKFVYELVAPDAVQPNRATHPLPTMPRKVKPKASSALNVAGWMVPHMHPSIGRRTYM